MSQRRIGWVILMSLLLLPSLVGADEALRLSFQEALRRAGREHVSVIVANERVQQAMARLWQARSTLLPQVGGTASETRQTRNLEAVGLSTPGKDPLIGPFNSFDARLTVTQRLFDAGALQRLSAAKAGQVLSLAESRKALQDAMALVATLYLHAQRATEALELAHAVLERAEMRLHIAGTRQQLGVGSPLEAKQAEAELTASVHQWQAALREAMERRLDLAAALGLPSDQPMILTGDERLVEEAGTSLREVLAAVSDHPEVEAAQRVVQERQAERRAELADALPRVSASVDYGASGSKVSDAEGTYDIGAHVSVPIFEGGLRAARVREAGSAVRASEAQLADARRHVEANALSALQSVQEARVLMEANRTALTVASKQLQLAQHRLRDGIGSALEVVEARTQAAVAADQQLEAQATARLASVHVAHAMGHMERLAAGPGGW